MKGACHSHCPAFGHKKTPEAGCLRGRGGLLGLAEARVCRRLSAQADASSLSHLADRVLHWITSFLAYHKHIIPKRRVKRHLGGPRAALQAGSGARGLAIDSTPNRV